MQAIKFPCIIGISGNSGAGKSTLSDSLRKELKATMVAWDDFDDISVGPEDYVDWLKHGASYAKWDYSKLAEVLRLLKSGSDVKHTL